MEWLIWIGAVMSAIGLVGIAVSLLRVMRARRSGQSDDQLRETMRRALPLNLGAFLLSVLGLMLVIVGILL